jgi:hypothetical protein
VLLTIGAGVVSGLGPVSQSYLNAVYTAPVSCPVDSFTLLGTTVRLSIAGKGEVTLALSGNSTCFNSLGVLNLSRPFTVTGGSGNFAGASGSGTVRHTAALGAARTTGTDTYSGTLAVPGSSST